ncbi:tetratricopeptide repeat protein [Calothrix sp. FACHB-156]|nr:tetratricopeptide repeat protein [Calothrix sp. FACHB-156]
MVDEKLRKSRTLVISAVAGMGGVGKTELVIQYLKTHEADYPGGICWLTVRESNLAAAIVEFTQLYMNLEVPQRNFQGNPLNLIEQVAWCWQHWRPKEGLVLVVLDDVTDLSICREFLPKTNRFRVLMTTRLRNLDANIEEISLDVLSPTEALQLLAAIVGEERLQKELETAEELCAWLGYLPLGLELVGRYLKKKPPHWTLAKMLQRLKAQRLEDEAVNPGLQKTLSTAQHGVKAAFELSWKELQPMTQSIAELLSLFAPNIFTWKWVESAIGLLNWNTTDLEIANEQLYEHHLFQFVEDTEDSSYKIHPLIREYLQSKLEVSAQKKELKQAFAKVFVAIAHNPPELPTLKFIKSVENAIPHLEEVVQNLIDVISNENLILPLTTLGKFYEGQGLYALAESWYEKCVSLAKSRLGEEHSDVATSFNNLAELYSLQGRYTEAEQLCLKALDLRQRLFGEEHPHVAQSYNNLASIYAFQRKHTEVEPLYLKALELRQRLLGEEHPDVVQSYHNLSMLYYYQRRYTEAEPLCLKAVELGPRLLGEEHPHVAIIYSNLAGLYLFKSQYTEAEQLYLKALKLRISQLGEEHSHVAHSYHLLAELYSLQGRYTEAEPLYLKAFKISECSLGVDHPNTIFFRTRLQKFQNNR